MRVNIKFTEDFIREFKVETAKELIGIHKQVLLKKYGKVHEEKEAIFEQLLQQLDEASAGDLIDFSILGDIKFNKAD